MWVGGISEWALFVGSDDGPPRRAARVDRKGRRGDSRGSPTARGGGVARVAAWSERPAPPHHATARDRCVREPQPLGEERSVEPGPIVSAEALIVSDLAA